MLCRSLKTLDELEEAEEREKQEEEKRVAKATAVTSFVLTSNLLLTSNPLARLEVPLLPPKV
jgi:hypothetical protein